MIIFFLFFHYKNVKLLSALIISIAHQLRDLKLSSSCWFVFGFIYDAVLQLFKSIKKKKKMPLVAPNVD